MSEVADASAGLPNYIRKMRKEHIKLWTFKNVIKRCCKNTKGAKGTVVIFEFENRELKVKRISQFGVIPDVVIELEEID